MSKKLGYVWTDSRGVTHHTNWGYHFGSEAHQMQKSGLLPTNWQRAETWLGKTVPDAIRAKRVPANAKVEIWKGGIPGGARREAYGPETGKRLYPTAAERGEAWRKTIALDYDYSRAGESFRRENVIIGNQSMPRKEFNKLDARYRSIAINQGYDAMDKAIDKDLATLEPYKKESGEYEIPESARANPEVNRAINALFQPSTVTKVEKDTWYYGDNRITETDKEKIINDWQAKRQELQKQVREGKNVEAATQALIKLGSHPENRMARTPEEAARLTVPILTLAAESIVPGLYVGRHWNEISPAEKALFIGLDVVSLLPVAYASVKGAKAVGTAGRTARALAALKAAGRETALIAKAPVDMIIHPIETTKGMYRTTRSLAELVAHPKRLPEAVISTVDGTVRLKVSETTSAGEAMAIRDELMKLAAKGERPVVRVGDLEYELARSPLMYELKGGTAHATPMGEAFEAGLKVKGKPNMPISEQGLFVSHEPLPKFTLSSAFGQTGQKPVIIITSPETAAKAIPSGKIYSGMAEMELKYPIGAKIPAPAQRLYTRVGPESIKVELWLEKPLTARQIAKLKAQGLFEAIITPFKPAITIKKVEGLALTDKEVSQLARIIRESGQADIASNLVRAERMAREAFGTARATRIASSLTRATRVGMPRRRVVPPTLNTMRARPTRAERERVRQQAITTTRRIAAETPERVTRADRTERQRVDRTERVERAERAERVTRTERAARTERAERIPRTSRISRQVKKLEEKAGKITKSVKDMTPEEKEKAFAHAYAWKQGFGWWAINELEQAAFFSKPLPTWKITDKKTAYATIQQIRGKPKPEPTTLDMGIMDVVVTSPVKEPGKKGAIKFSRDIKQKTAGDIELGAGGRSEKGIGKLPLGTSLKQLITGNYPSGVSQSMVSKMLSQKVRKASRQELVTALASTFIYEQQYSSTPSSSGGGIHQSTADVLSHLPDRVRKQVERQLQEYYQIQFAPTSRLPRPTKTSRRKKRTLRTGSNLPSTGVVTVW